MKQLRSCVASNNDVAAVDAGVSVNVKKFVDKNSGVDSDTSGDDFIDVGRSKRSRTKPRQKFHGSALNLSSDVDSLYDSSSGGLFIASYYSFLP